MSNTIAEKSKEGCVFAILFERVSPSRTASACRLSGEGDLFLSLGVATKPDAGVFSALIMYPRSQTVVDLLSFVETTPFDESHRVGVIPTGKYMDKSGLMTVNVGIVPLEVGTVDGNYDIQSICVFCWNEGRD